jgi:hypothetical protein
MLISQTWCLKYTYTHTHTHTHTHIQDMLQIKISLYFDPCLNFFVYLEYTVKIYMVLDARVQNLF